MKIIHKLQTVLHKQEKDFITSLYYELLNRKPDTTGYKDHFYNLSSGVSKISIISSFLLSNEARVLYQQHSHITPHTKGLTICTTLQKIFALEDEPFISSIYQEFLNRNPDVNNLKKHLYALKKGKSRLNFLKEIFWSDECQTSLGQNLTSDLIINRIKQLLDNQ
ncbi:DUF4214 domain-containing protein [Peribacillus frigoritolerans]|uniref:DUF4214 domain-containing protein n=1 Tax=Peribacillus frigoritolerans TaxID=450367 RepID=UPI002040D753|nr:DUF4214 domain-containing protein [Peribacillus frigoritolerans]MCM3166849.1 DUF4214 domain-containing protein [Peribacillus frigoritolerans]